RFQRLLNEPQAMFGTFFAHFPFIGGLIDRLTELIARLERNFIKMGMFVQVLIDDHLDPKRPKPELEDIPDVLQMWSDGSNIQLTWDHIKGILTDIVVAGTDTTGTIVTWAMKLQMKMFKTYLKAVVKEIMRLHQVDPLIPRQTTQSCKLHGHDIPAKSLVYINALAIGRDPEENPEEFFNPNMFIDSFIDLNDRYSRFIPFGGVHRICPRINLGIAIVYLTLSYLLYKFDWIPTRVIREDLDLEVFTKITMHKKRHIHLSAKGHI
ncbi:LOW QUALITY PROTEIN: p450 domain-containing protein, partial [Cephalotus follicularis]